MIHFIDMNTQEKKSINVVDRLDALYGSTSSRAVQIVGVVAVGEGKIATIFNALIEDEADTRAAYHAMVYDYASDEAMFKEIDVPLPLRASGQLLFTPDGRLVWSVGDRIWTWRVVDALTDPGPYSGFHGGSTHQPPPMD